MDEEIEKRMAAFIKAAMKSAKGEVGYKAMEAICDYFSRTDHPHTVFTFERAAMNRDIWQDDTNKAAKELAYEMAYLVVQRDIFRENMDDSEG